MPPDEKKGTQADPQRHRESGRVVPARDYVQDSLDFSASSRIVPAPKPPPKRVSDG